MGNEVNGHGREQSLGFRDEVALPSAFLLLYRLTVANVQQKLVFIFNQRPPGEN